MSNDVLTRDKGLSHANNEARLDGVNGLYAEYVRLLQPGAEGTSAEREAAAYIQSEIANSSVGVMDWLAAAAEACFAEGRGVNSWVGLLAVTAFFDGESKKVLVAIHEKALRLHGGAEARDVGAE
jgi:hypothetical protein